MCGITGIFAFNLVGKINKIHVTQATMNLEKRGPDFQDIYLDDWVGLGHRRLSIIDTRDASNQPMWDESGRYCIVYNGEIFNYRELRKELKEKGFSFFSEGDTEVLLKLFIAEGESCLTKVNGFFSFCVYDKAEQSMFVARDRFGIKPMLYIFDEDKFIFSSEMKSILSYGIERSLDYTSLLQYLQLNYIPAPHTILSAVKKLLPGQYMKVTQQKMEIKRHYQIPYNREAAANNSLTFDEAKKRFKELLETSVQRRLVADVPLGCFLSGGMDSSVVAALASKHKPDLHTFSIGFRDEPFFDETHYAKLVADHLKTSHTVFSLTNDDLYAHVHSILDYLDEPFADSSAIAVYILAKQTRKHATVALSGDGADELLAGYNKHAAFYRMQHKGWKENLVRVMHPLWRVLPKSRNNPLANRVRQLERFSKGMQLSLKDRYWHWATFASETDAINMISAPLFERVEKELTARRSEILHPLSHQENLNDVLLTDMQLVLPNDMLAKVDLMSMANSLEVRVPFLDYELVNFVFSLPEEFKINSTLRKRILQEAFRDMLPPELYMRPKKGFEVPLLKWFRKEMKSLIMDDLLSGDFVKAQGIFAYSEIERLKRQLFSANPGDVHARIWGLIVFQWWWKKYLRA